MFCTEFDPSKYTISFNVIPYHVMKFDFAEFDQPLIISKIRQDHEIDVWIRGEKHKVLFKEMNFSAENIGTYSYSGLLDGTSRNEVILTIGKNVTSGSVIWGGDTFYITPVGIKKDAAGNTSPVSIIYNERDVEEYRIDLSNDVITPPITLTHYESF